MESRWRRWFGIAVLCLVVLGATGGLAFAQGASERSGFTILGNMGVGIQSDSALEESAMGLAGINLGVGGFLSENLALMFRFSGTAASYDLAPFDRLDQVSGVGGPSLQYWLSNRFNVEAGAGLGLWQIGDASERGFGLILGAGRTIFNKGKHNLQIGLEYAPAFTKSSSVHNVGITLGYQFF